MSARDAATGDSEAGASVDNLPAALQSLVAGVVRRARLDPAERRGVTAELTAHFLDGLRAGAAPDELATAFGDPRQAGRLIGRAMRRRRSPLRRIRRCASHVLLAIASLVIPTYAMSAIRLHSAVPARPGDIDAEVAVERDLLGRARVLASEARDAFARGDGAGAVERLIASLDVARRLADHQTLASELGRMLVLDETVSAITAHDADALGSRERQLLAARLRDELARGSLALRDDVLDHALTNVLDGVYATQEAGGRPAASGLRTLQALKANGEPGLAALLLEPVYFVAPARRQEVARELDRLQRAVRLEATGGERGLLDRELARIERDSWSTLRLVPVVLLNRRLASAVLASRRLELSVPQLVAILE
jgi:hypothetical protein